MKTPNHQLPNSNALTCFTYKFPSHYGPMYVITDLKPGRAIILDGEPYLIVTSQFGRKSQSKANMQCKLKNLKTGAIVARNFQGSEQVEPADVGYRRVQYLYKDDTGYTFMDLTSYDQFALDTDTVGDAVQYLVDGQEVDALVFDEQPIGISLPATVNLKVVETIPGVKGDTATGGTKPATVESGAVINVPLFITEGDVIKINTDTGTYMSRAE